MAVRVVTEQRGGHVARRGLRLLASVLGGLLALVGLVAFSLPTLVLVVHAVDRLDGEPVEPLESPSGLAITAAAGLAALVVGRLLLRGRRRQVLFLRKFGFTDASRLMTYAVGTAIGRHWRLVTLDDDEIAPVGARRSSRRVASLVWLGAITVIVVGVLWLTGDGLDGFIDRTVREAEEQAEASGSSGFGSALGAALGGVLVGVFVAALVGFGLLVVASVSVFAAGSYLSVRRAERAKSPRIRDERDVARVIRKVDRLLRRVFAARLVVVRVASPVWQQAVRGFAGAADAVIIDLSSPTENLLWEIEHGAAPARDRRVLVGRGDRVAPSFATVVADQAIAQRLDAALDGQTVLAYDVRTASGRRRFAKALRHRLEDLA